MSDKLTAREGVEEIQKMRGHSYADCAEALDDILRILERVNETPAPDIFPDTHADGVEFCGKCGSRK